MVMQMQKVISSCERSIQIKGAQSKAPLQAILVTSPLELFHVDFTSIEITPEQTAKTVARFLWQGYI